MTTPNSKWYDRVRTQTLTRIEETLTHLKTLHASEADAQTPEELEEILTQQIATICDLQTHTKALHTSTTTRRNLNTNPNGADHQQKTYTYQYTAEPDEK